MIIFDESKGIKCLFWSKSCLLSWHCTKRPLRLLLQNEATFLSALFLLFFSYTKCKDILAKHHQTSCLEKSWSYDLKLLEIIFVLDILHFISQGTRLHRNAPSCESINYIER